MSVALPILDDLHPVENRDVLAYARDGHTVIRGVASPTELAAYRPLIREAMERNALERKASGKQGGYASYFQQVTNLWRQTEELRQLIFARRFAAIAARLMGVSAVRLYHDQALFKPAGGKATPWHQDQFYWPLDTPHTITLWMPLIDLTEEMGGMIFASGSHTEGSLIPQAISEETDHLFEELVRVKGYPVVRPELRQGDATFHAGWTVHSARPNASETVREALTVIYFADGARIVEPETTYRRVDMEAFHPGQKPGDFASSPLNPVLFHE